MGGAEQLEDVALAVADVDAPGRVAINFRPCASGTDDLTAGFLPLNDWRLLAFGYRLVDDRRGGLRKRAPLAIYRPRPDFPGTGRIGFACSAVFDLAASCHESVPVLRLHSGRHLGAARAAVAMHQAVEDTSTAHAAIMPVLPRFYWAYHPEHPPVFETTFTAEEWAAAELRIGDLRASPAEMLARRPGWYYAVHPVDGSDNPSEAHVAVATPAGNRVGWLRRGNAWIPRPQEPLAIFAAPEHLRGRSVRNPVYDALRRVGLVPDDRRYHQWLYETGLYRRGPSDVPRAADEFREWVATALASREGAEAALLAETRAGCEAAGAPLPDDAEGSLQALASLVMSPWQPLHVPSAGAVQVLRADDPSGARRSKHHGDVADFDLDDLGDDAGFYDPIAAQRY